MLGKAVNGIMPYNSNSLGISKKNKLTGTWYVSSIWNCAGSLSFCGVLDDRRFKNIVRRSRFSPDTLDT